MKNFIRIAVLSAAVSVAMQTGLARAQGTFKELWPEDSPATLSFGDPENEDAPRFPAQGEFVNPETEERVSAASPAFGDPDPDSTAGQKGRTYFAGEPAGMVHPTQ